jgi:transketolase
VDAWVVDMHTIKPLDREMLVEVAQKTKGIVTCEEHSIFGGLGSAVAEVLSEEHPTRVYRIGVRDRFGESGEPEALYEHFGLTPTSIYQAALSLLK